MELQSGEIKALRKEIRQANRRSIAAVSGASLVLSAAILLALDGFAPAMIWNAPALTWALGGAGLALLIFAWPPGPE